MLSWMMNCILTEVFLVVNLRGGHQERGDLHFWAHFLGVKGRNAILCGFWGQSSPLFFVLLWLRSGDLEKYRARAVSALGAHEVDFRIEATE